MLASLLECRSLSRSFCSVGFGGRWGWLVVAWFFFKVGGDRNGRGACCLFCSLTSVNCPVKQKHHRKHCVPSAGESEPAQNILSVNANSKRNLLCEFAFSLSLTAPLSHEHWASLRESTNAPLTGHSYMFCCLHIFRSCSINMMNSSLR